MLTKILAEEQFEKYACDVMVISGGEIMTLMTKGLYAKYRSSQSKLIPESSKDPKGYWTDVYMTMNGIGYNTK